MLLSVRWAFNLSKWEPTEKEFLLASSCLQIEEKNRIDKFAYKKDAKASLVGRLMIRKFISENMNVPYSTIKFSRDENNKPIYVNPDPKFPKFNFNISHHGSFTVLAGETVDIGVDAMNLEYTGKRDLYDFFRIMNRNFSATEWRKIMGTSTTSKQNQITTFYRNWALKESYVKALGIGITIDLSEIEFRIKSDLQENEVISDTCLYINNKKQPWIFEESLLDPYHCVAVALAQENYSCISSKDKLFKIISPESLLENVVPLLEPDLEYSKRYFLKE